MRQNTQDEAGLVSIVVVTIIIIILSLMSIGFAKIMDREYRQSIDKELSIQADYAAESGVNDARAYIVNLVKTGGTFPASGTCLDLGTPPAGFVKDGSISGSHTAGNNTVKYSCVIIDPTPHVLHYEIKKGESAVFKVTTLSALQRLYFSWENLNPPESSPGVPCFSPITGALGALPQESALSTCATGVLRAGIYPIPSALGADPNATIEANARSFFMYPTTGAGIGNINYNSNNPFVSGECDTTNRTNPPGALPGKPTQGRYCNSRIQNVPGASFYYVRLTALYRDLSVDIQADGPGPGSLAVGGAEATVDVTGEGNNVLRRLKSYVTLKEDLAVPNYTIQSIDTLCKKLRVPYGLGGALQPAGYADPASSDTYVSSACGANGVMGPAP